MNVTFCMTKEEAQTLEWFMADRLDDYEEHVLPVLLRHENRDALEKDLLILKNVHATLQGGLRQLSESEEK